MPKPRLLEDRGLLLPFPDWGQAERTEKKGGDRVLSNRAPVSGHTGPSWPPRAGSGRAEWAEGHSGVSLGSVLPRCRPGSRGSQMPTARPMRNTC